MTIKRLLVIIPTALILFLLQSYFWVPTYEEQTKGNPQRLVQYVTASIGDASLLNPILSADSASSQIESLVFDSLIDRDENLRFRGRLAKSWEIYEEAYFYVNKDAAIPRIGNAGAQEIASLLISGKTTPGIPAALQDSLRLIKRIEILPPRQFNTITWVRTKEIDVTVKAPPRIRLVLSKVDQDLFKNLTLILGQRLLPSTEHNPIIVFHLRPGVVFHDGHPFTARDVKFTYEAIMDPKNLSPRVSDYEPVRAVQVLDPLTVKVIYKRLYSPALGTWGIGILPEHLLNKKALRKEALERGMDPNNFSIRQSRFNRHPIGCGPFVFREWKADRHIILDRFEKYWEGPPNYKQYVFRIIPDLLTQEMEFYAGTVDSYSVQPHQVARLKNDLRFQSFSGTSFGYTYIGYNMRREPFKDRRVRLALGMAINVDEIIKYVLYGQGERITGPFVKQTDYYNYRIKPLPYDPEGALRLLEEAGWKRNNQGWLEKDGKKLQFTLITNSGNDLRKAILAIAQDSWKRIGIDVRTDVLEWSVFIQERIDKADFDAVILGWQMGIEPDLYQIWHSSQTHPYQLNFVGFKNKQADDLIIKIRQEYDHDKQVQYCHKLHEIIAREQPYTFLYVSKWTAVLDKRIVIKDVDENGNVVYRKITPTKTGDYTFYFNKWIKLPEVPRFSPEG
ncbi:MAG: peptide-binding protein [Deltaproteobacteria bacterium]|nr:peptide-binding protein [Deltaproteobacteria bacterium]